MIKVKLDKQWYIELSNKQIKHLGYYILVPRQDLP